MTPLTSIVSGFAALAPGLKSIHALVRESRGRKRELLRELGHNIDKIAVFVEGGSDAERVDRVIASLETSCYEDASRAGFDLNTLKRSKLKADLVKELPQFKPYVGMNTEELFDKIYASIHRLKVIVSEYPNDSRFRKSVRLINILKLMLLLVRHIRSA